MDSNVKVCAYDLDYKALSEQFPSLEIDCFIQDFIRKPIEISKPIERLEIELLI